jgi:enoyl-CoA hydratase
MCPYAFFLAACGDIASGMSSLTYNLDGDVALLAMDDNKANALSHPLIDAFHEALDRAEKEARAVVLAGRPGLFCAGFDLGPMTAGPDSARDLVKAGSLLNTRLILHPQPVVAACTGHALAAGSLLLLSVDTRVGAGGRFKIGLNEVAIGLRLPIFAAELARDRLCKRHLIGATIEARLFDPEGACAVGFLDRVVPADETVSTAMEEARQLAKLNLKALAETKRIVRGPMVDRVKATLDEDLRDLDASEVRPKG